MVFSAIAENCRFAAIDELRKHDRKMAHFCICCKTSICGQTPSNQPKKTEKKETKMEKPRPISKYKTNKANKKKNHSRSPQELLRRKNKTIHFTNVIPPTTPQDRLTTQNNPQMVFATDQTNIVCFPCVTRVTILSPRLSSVCECLQPIKEFVRQHRNELTHNTKDKNRGDHR